MGFASRWCYGGATELIVSLLKAGCVDAHPELQTVPWSSMRSQRVSGSAIVSAAFGVVAPGSAA